MAVTYLQRALLNHDLQTLAPLEWESCFNKVLFPLLAKLLLAINIRDPTGVEEIRVRAATLLCKVSAGRCLTDSRIQIFQDQTLEYNSGESYAILVSCKIPFISLPVNSSQLVS